MCFKLYENPEVSNLTLETLSIPGMTNACFRLCWFDIGFLLATVFRYHDTRYRYALSYVGSLCMAKNHSLNHLQIKLCSDKVHVFAINIK